MKLFLIVLLSIASIQCSRGSSRSSSTPAGSALPGSTLQIEPLFDADGLAVSSLTSQDLAGEVKLPAPTSDNKLQGYVKFSPGTLVVNGTGTIMIEQGAPMGDELLGELQTDQTVSALGAGMLVQGDENTAVKNPFVLAIDLPVEEVSLRLINTENLAVLYKFYDRSTGILNNHLIFGNDIKVVDQTVIVSAPGFGVYQSVLLNTLPAQKIDVQPALTKYLRNDKCTQVVDEDGVGRPIVSLSEIPVSYATIKPCGHFVNASNAASFKLSGRCSKLGSAITVSGALQKSYSCENYLWGETLDLSSLPDGNHSITLSMSESAKVLDTKTIVLQKDTVLPTASLSNFVQKEENRGSEWRMPGALSLDVRYFSIEKKSGPGIFSYAIVDQPVSNGVGTGMIGLNVAATAVGDYIVAFRFMDGFGNEVIVEASCTIVYTVDPDAVSLLPPANFNLAYDDGAGVRFNFKDRSTDSDAAATGVVGYLFVKRIGAAVTWAPVDGQTYSVGALDANHQMIGTSSFYLSADTNVVNGQTYHYAVFEVGVGSRYSQAAHGSVTVTPLSANQVAFLGGFPDRLYFANDKLFVGKSSRGFAIYDISGAFNVKPSLLTEKLTATSVNDLYARGNYLYIAEADRLEIYDVTSPSAPNRVASFQTTARQAITDVDGFGSYIFIAAASQLIALDVSNPLIPIELDRVSVSGGNIKNLVAIEDGSGTDYVYAASSSEVYAFNVETKTNLSELSKVSAGSYTISDIAYGLDGSDKRIYVAAGETMKGVRAVDANNPNSLSFTNTYTPGDTTGSSGGVTVTTDNANVVLVNTFSGLWTATMEPARTDSFDGNGYNTSGDATDVVTSGDYAYVADKRGGIVVVDISTIDDPQLTQRVATLDDPERFTLSGNYAYVADRWNGLHIIDLSTTLAPKFEGLYTVDAASANHDSNGYIQDVVVIDNHAFIAAGAEGVVKLDVSNKASPSFVSVNRTGFSDAKRIARAGNNLVVIDNSNGLFILDQSLTLLGSSSSYSPTSMIYDGSHLVLGLGTSGIVWLDISNPASFNTPVSSLALTGRNISAVYRQGNRLYASDAASNHVLSIDVSTVTAPVLRQSINSGGSSLGVINALGNYLYVVGAGNLFVFDTSTPDALFLKGKLLIEGQYSRDIQFKDGKVLTTDSHSQNGSGLSVHNSL